MARIGVDDIPVLINTAAQLFLLIRRIQQQEGLTDDELWARVDAKTAELKPLFDEHLARLRGE